MRQFLSRLVVTALLLTGGCQPFTTIAHHLPAEFDYWHFVDPHRTDVPDLITLAGDAYRLPPDWEISKIEYLYRWAGLGEGPLFDYQVIAKNGTAYLNGKTTVPSQDVSAFVAAVSNLHVSQSLVAGVDHTDDYPDWKIELTGVDGRKLFISSSSTANADSAPWNVLENGKLYAQYDGSLGAAAAKLFQAKVGQSLPIDNSGGRGPNREIFGVSGFPAQLQDGFDGLLPLADDFEYSIDNSLQKIEGRIYGRFSRLGMGHMVVGNINTLTYVSLSAANGSMKICSTKSVMANDPVPVEWTFECPISGLVDGKPYRYGLTVKFGTDAGDTLEMKGNLFGIASHVVVKPLLALPTSFEKAFQTSQAITDLLKYQKLVTVNYEAVIDPKDPDKGNYAGAAIFAGEMHLGSRTLGYTVGTPFSIVDGVLTRWALSQTAVDQLLEDVLALPITSQMLKSVKDTPLSLWYAENGETPDMPFLIGGGPAVYQVSLAPCGPNPRVDVPAPGQPLREFGIDGSYSPDFVLVNKVPIAIYLDFRRDASDFLAPLLLPKELMTAGRPIFERVMLNTFWPGQPALIQFDLDANASADLKAAYDKAAAALPVKIEKTYDTLWEAKGLTFTAAQDGTLQLTACASQK